MSPPITSRLFAALIALDDNGVSGHRGVDIHLIERRSPASGSQTRRSRSSVSIELKHPLFPSRWRGGSLDHTCSSAAAVGHNDRLTPDVPVVRSCPALCVNNGETPTGHHN